MCNTSRINAGFFFEYFIFHPTSKVLTRKEKIVCTTLSVALGILTVGTVHLATYIGLKISDQLSISIVSPKSFFNKYMLNPTHSSLTRKEKIVCVILSIVIGILSLGIAHLVAHCKKNREMSPKVRSSAILPLKPGEKVPSAVTYIGSYGRLGDQMLCYAHALWISYKYRIHLLFREFAGSEHFTMHHRDLVFENNPRLRANPQEWLRKDVPFEPRKDSSKFYIIPFFTESLHERNNVRISEPYFEVDWNDAGFRKVLKEAFTPVTSFPQLNLPTDRFCVALHVRRGGGYDSAAIRAQLNKKFPPDEFYIEQIKKIAKKYNRPLYIHIFTDDPEPKLIAEKYQKAIADEVPDVEFGYRETGNSHKANVLEDFYQMAQFECMVRPNSNLSLMASVIGNCTDCYHTEQ